MIMGKQKPLVRKPVLEWTPEDVALWVGSLGPWAKDYESRFLASGIDGNLLIDMNEKDLEQYPLSISFSPHRRALLKESENLRSHGMKIPTDFWQYKVNYLAKMKTLFSVRLFVFIF